MATNAEHQAAFRKRQKDEIERLRRLVKALERKNKILLARLSKLT
jgi:hypothetical protein